MPAKIRIRQTDDLDQVQEMDRELFDASLADVLHVSTWWLAEAMVDGSWTPVGYAGAEITNGGAYMFLSRAGVVELARGAGLQRKLIRVRERWARAHGCTHAWTYTHWANTKSQTSLVREGYVPFTYEVSDDVRFLHFRKSLAKKGAPRVAFR